MEDLIGHDAWKTTEPRHFEAEWEAALELADEIAGEAYDDAAEWASLFETLGLEGPDPRIAAARARELVILEARRGGL